jgi:hypothetical protein
MKYEDNNNPETKKLLKTHKSPFRSQDSSFLSHNFLVFLKTINIALLSYIIFSTFFYFIVHYYGKRIINSKTLRLEYDNLLYQNLFVNFYFILASVLGFISISRKSILYFCWFYTTLNLYSTLFITSYISNFYYDYFFHSKFVWLGITLTLVNISIFCYLIFYFFSIISQNQNEIKYSRSPPSKIIHEINLRIDMFKISFNHFIIKTKLHKLIPSLLYTRDSYYFMTLRNDYDKTEGGVEKHLNVDMRSGNTDSTFYRTKNSIEN